MRLTGCWVAVVESARMVGLPVMIVLQQFPVPVLKQSQTKV